MAPPISLISVIFLKERISLINWIGVLTVSVGVLLVPSISNSSFHAPNRLLGNIFMILSVVSWAFYTIQNKKLSDLSGRFATFYISAAGTLFLLPFAILEMCFVKGPHFTSRVIYEILYLGIVSSAVCYLLYSHALNRLDAFDVGSFINPDPMIGVFTAWLFLKEQITITEILSSIFILPGLWFCIRPSGKDKPPR